MFDLYKCFVNFISRQISHVKWVTSRERLRSPDIYNEYIQNCREQNYRKKKHSLLRSYHNGKKLSFVEFNNYKIMCYKVTFVKYIW